MKLSQLIKEAKKAKAKYGDLDVHVVPFAGRTCPDCLQIKPIVKDGQVYRTFIDHDYPYWFMLEFNRDTLTGTQAEEE